MQKWQETILENKKSKNSISVREQRFDLYRPKYASNDVI